MPLTNDVGYALDNDSLSEFLRGQQALVDKVLSTPSSQIWIPAVAVEEQIRGRLAVLAKLYREPPERVAQAYDAFLKTLTELQNFQVLPHSKEAEALYQSWPPQIKKIGTRDCRIAASAIANGLIVVTRNRQDFEKIPNVIIEDWSR